MRKRIKWLDFGKGIAIAFVVLMHALQYNDFHPFYLKTLINLFCVFIMPIFFAISGYLYKNISSKKSYYNVLYKKVSGFLIPYSVFVIIVFYLDKYNMLTKELGEYHYNNIINVFFSRPGSYLWFLLVLFILFLFISSISAFCSVHELKFRVNIAILILLLALIIQYFHINGGIKLFIWCSLGFVIGYIMKHYRYMIERFQNIILVIITFIFISVYYFNWPKYQQPFSTDSFNKNDIILKLLSIPISFIIFIKLPHNRFFNYFCHYGKYTLFIYLIHFPILLFVGKLLKVIFINNFIFTIMLFIITWYLSILSCKTLHYFGFIKFIFYPRKYIDPLIRKTNFGEKLLNKK